MKKLLLSLSLVLGLFAVAPIGIHAEECHDHEVYVSVYGEEETVIMPRAQICLDCGLGILTPTTTYSKWESGGEQKCIHYPYGTDKILVREVRTKYTCNRCGMGTDPIYTTETKYECHGYY